MKIWRKIKTMHRRAKYKKESFRARIAMEEAAQRDIDARLEVLNLRVRNYTRDRQKSEQRRS